MHGGSREGVLPAIKRVIRYLRRYHRCIIEISSDQSDWAGTRKSCSGGSLQLGTYTIHHWSKLQANVALSSGEAELNSAVKGINEAIWLRELLREILQVTVTIRIHVDASAC